MAPDDPDLKSSLERGPRNGVRGAPLKERAEDLERSMGRAPLREKPYSRLARVRRESSSNSIVPVGIECRVWGLAERTDCDPFTIF